MISLWHRLWAVLGSPSSSGPAAPQLRLRLIPSPQNSFLLIFSVAMASVLLGLISREPPQVSSKSRVAPSTVPGAVLGGGVIDVVLSLSDVVSLSPEFELRKDKTGAVDNDAAAQVWGDVSAARKRHEKWGRVGGYSSDLWRPLSAAEDIAPVEIQSTVSLYRTAQGAQEAFQYYKQHSIGPNPQAISTSSLGDATAAFRVANGPFVSFLVLFQMDNAVVSLLTTSFSEKANLRVAESLAELMAARVR